MDMNQDRLYLLKPDFMDQSAGPYFCPGCAQMVGLLEFYPALKQHLQIRWLDFPRPRPELIELLGEEKQSCPVLVLKEGPLVDPTHLHLQHARGRWFIEGANEIANYLARAHRIGIPH